MGNCVVVAIAHLEVGDGHNIEGQLHDRLAGLDPKLLVTPVILNRTITLAGRPQGIAHLEALDSLTDVKVESLIWGAVNGAPRPSRWAALCDPVRRLRAIRRSVLPRRFQTSELPPDDLVKVLRLMVATDSAEFMQTYRFSFGDALAPFIREARAMADDSPRPPAGAQTPAHESAWSSVLPIGPPASNSNPPDYLKASAGDFQAHSATGRMTAIR